ncbi:hypothetical protein PENSTE_c019G00159 [Penicillium steckii]|uniref:3CxxC-type domain-containing protein n=1 Tax=Penicillium steckii TaxID=303698 RepID=A0A1V6SVD8_9EURO|nr:hypothetical protein PENSTE_c019G00159 [Penicillium steckii]
MTRKRQNKKAKKWSMYQSLHSSVSTLLAEENLAYQFNSNDNDTEVSDSYDSFIMGRFTCHNPTCKSDGWSSKKIAITIRKYPGFRYNVRVYHQRCKSCNSLSKPYLDHSYAERVAYRLKKWEGIRMEKPNYSGKSNGPHNQHLCEGCKAGHCEARF